MVIRLMSLCLHIDIVTIEVIGVLMVILMVILNDTHGYSWLLTDRYTKRTTYSIPQSPPPLHIVVLNDYPMSYSKITQ